MFQNEQSKKEREIINNAATVVKLSSLTSFNHGV